MRQSACIIIDKPIKSEEIKQTKLSARKCVVGRYEISFFEFKNAWTEMHAWVKDNNIKNIRRRF